MEGNQNESFTLKNGEVLSLGNKFYYKTDIPPKIYTLSRIYDLGDDKGFTFQIIDNDGQIQEHSLSRQELESLFNRTIVRNKD